MSTTPVAPTPTPAPEPVELPSTGFFTTAHIAGLASFLTGLASAVVGVADVFPTGWQSAIFASVGIITATATALNYMIGVQKADANATQLAMEMSHQNIYARHLENQNEILQSQHAELLAKLSTPGI